MRFNDTVWSFEKIVLSQLEVKFLFLVITLQAFPTALKVQFWFVIFAKYV